MLSALLDALNAVTRLLGDAVFAALAPFPPGLSLWILSALLGASMLLAWRYTSNQPGIRHVRRQIAAELLATRLFRDNLAVTFRAQRRILWYALRLLGYSLRPMLIMLVPFVLVMAQLGLRYEHRPAHVGETLRVTAVLKDSAGIAAGGDQLRLPPGVQCDPFDPCRVPALRTVDWRVTPDQPGDHLLRFGPPEQPVEVPLRAGHGFCRVSPQRGGGWWERLLFSAEPGLPADSLFEVVRVHYPMRANELLGFELHWLISLLILSIIFALVFKPFMKVHF